ncbi:MAG TPA: carboxypeptidase-like regulatory domain-containing protein [Polyangiaceae bacterium]|jgi:hypothetical protein
MRGASFLLIALAACDPGWSGTAHLIDATGAPIAGATATLKCPSGHVEHETSDATGTFVFGGVGSSFEAPKCTVTIDAPGFASRTVTVYDLCYRSTHAGNAGVPRKPGEGTILLSRAPVLAPADAGPD